MKQRRKQSAEICLLTEKILQLELYILLSLHRKEYG